MAADPCDPSAFHTMYRGGDPAESLCAGCRRERHNRDVVCLVSGTLFIFHHILNMIYYGFSVMFCLNVFLMRVLFCLLVRAVSPVHSHPCYMTGNITINRAGASG